MSRHDARPGEAVTEPPAVSRFHLTSTDPDEALEHIRAAYSETGMSGLPSEDFRFDLVGVGAGPVEFSAMRYLWPTAWTLTEPAERLIVVRALGDTRLRVEHERSDTFGPVVLTPTTSSYRSETHNHLRYAAVALDPSEVARVAHEMTGLRPDALEFHAWAPRSPGLARYWTGLTTHLHRDVLAHDDVLAEPLLREQVLQQLATALLTVFPNTTHTLEPRRGRRDTAEPATVRRAVEFIHAHAHEPVTVAEVAHAAGVSVRGLQHAFARHRDATPLGFLRQVRLHRAHADLVAADPHQGDTVAAIAARWGFGQPARFAAAYRREFDRAPSVTLRE